MLRLRRKSDIDRTLREGRRFHSPCFVVHARRRTPQEGVPPTPRVATSTARRFPSAVARNRARRLLREAARRALGPREAPWDLLLVGRPELLGLSFRELLAALTDLLARAGVLAQETAAIS